MQNSIRKLMSILIVLGVLFSIFSPAAVNGQAATITFIVNSTLDLPDAGINEQCSANQLTGGPCTLRAAVREAIAANKTKTVDIKIMPGVYSLTRVYDVVFFYNTGSLNIENGPNPIRISAYDPANRPTIDASSLENRIFNVALTATLELQDLILTGGKVVASNLDKGGGAIYNGGTLRMERVDLIGNSVILNPSYPGYLPFVVGGGLDNRGEAVIQDSLFFLNQAHFAGAIHNKGPAANLKLIRSKVTNNLGNETILLNLSQAEMSIVNSSVSGNKFSSSNHNVVISDNSVLNINASSLVNLEGGTILNIGNAYSTANFLNLQDSILYSYSASGTYNNCSVGANSYLNSGGYNISNDNSCPINSPGDLHEVDPKITLRQTLFGLDPEHTLLEGSPAINNRTGNCIVDGNVLKIDLRGVLRSDGKCDTGAFERNFPIYLPAIRK